MYMRWYRRPSETRSSFRQPVDARSLFGEKLVLEHPLPSPPLPSLPPPTTHHPPPITVPAAIGPPTSDANAAAAAAAAATRAVRRVCLRGVTSHLRVMQKGCDTRWHGVARLESPPSVRPCSARKGLPIGGCYLSQNHIKNAETAPSVLTFQRHDMLLPCLNFHIYKTAASTRSTSTWLPLTPETFRPNGSTGSGTRFGERLICCRVLWDGITKVIDWAQDKQARMTPWGVQYLSPERGEWVPYLSGILNATICGRWIREQPHQCINCGGSASCPGSAPRVGIPSCLGDLMYAVQNSHLADPSLDIMKDEKLATTPPQNDSCRITELPTELLQHIINYLLPCNTTYHFFPARLDTTRSVPIVQKFTSQPAVMENAPPPDGVMKRYQPVRYNTTDRPPATASAHLALAATCKRLQEEVYSFFFAENSFILHITAGTIENAVRSTDFRQFQTWTRILPNPAKHKDSLPWPMTARAASYMRNVTLIISLPPAPISKDIDILEAKVSEAMATLSAAKHLDNMTIDFQQSIQKRDKRYTAQILNIDSLEADVDGNGKLSITVHDPNIQSVRTWNKAQRALRPLLRGPRGVKKVVLRTSKFSPTDCQESGRVRGGKQSCQEEENDLILVYSTVPEAYPNCNPPRSFLSPLFPRWAFVYKRTLDVLLTRSYIQRIDFWANHFLAQILETARYIYVDLLFSFIRLNCKKKKSSKHELLLPSIYNKTSSMIEGCKKSHLSETSPP
ncbi:uncharacterized protein MYCFIDRAFT_179093 [Pseudocercospora fijiensis CIRAD86]|uniref:Uncharacterized protein n=1 Tax=Pseudocercospora fijiensis (strain CIRAD86) TaxID=383855 RepID=M2ZEL3_PSEFD|nr:uncharacterized protein MYCFIDRAFT_179093 [Pseudocercospora fijiensis CIRAD86]EME77574.1 hypothetical protein MYCFIDRAFT_179093 [Pseudocercospora fijiensis CIRAD86]